jgi:peroxiredoxin
MNKTLGSGSALRLLFLGLFGIQSIFGALPFGVSALQAGEALAAPASASAKAPEFDLPDLNGSTVSLGKYKDSKPVLLYFWATWCPYCIAARPSVIKLRNEVSQDDLEILGINVGAGDSIEKVKRFQEKYPTPFPMLYDGEGKLTQSYMVQGIPLFVLVDKSGMIRYRSNAMPSDWKKLVQ